MGLVLVIAGSRRGEKTMKGTQPNGNVWDWDWLLGAAGVVREQLEGQSGTVLFGNGTGYWRQQGEGVSDSGERERTKCFCVGLAKDNRVSRGVRKQREGQNETVLCGNCNGYCGQQEVR